MLNICGATGIENARLAFVWKYYGITHPASIIVPHFDYRVWVELDIHLVIQDALSDQRAGPAHVHAALPAVVVEAVAFQFLPISAT